MEDLDDTPRKPGKDGNSSVALFLALYLLLLAFFILLNTISTFEEVKTKQVKESLSSAFASILPPTTSQQSPTAFDGPVIAAQEFQEEIGELFETNIKVVRIKVVQPGKQMEVTMIADQLFEVDSDKIRDQKRDFMRRLSKAMASAPDNLRYEVEMLMGVEAGPGGQLEVAQTLEMRRGGAFARELRARGAPRDSVFVGVDPGGDPLAIRFFFYIEPVTRAEEAPEEEGEG